MMSMMKKKISYKSLQIYTKKERKSQYNKSKNKDDEAKSKLFGKSLKRFIAQFCAKPYDWIQNVSY